MNLPNSLTVGRILLVPLIVWLLSLPRYDLALAVFVLAGLTDLVDGYLARRFGQKTLVGAYLDPLADKALLVSVYVTLGFKGAIELWLVVIVVSRDIAIVAAVLLSHLIGVRVRISPLFISKVNTVGQILFVLFVLGAYAFAVEVVDALWLGSVVVAGLTLASWVAYLIEWLRALAAGQPRNGLGA